MMNRTWPVSQYPGFAHAPAASQSTSYISPVKPKQRRHKHSEEAWDALRDTIISLYIDEDKKVEEVLEILKTKHGFQVGLRKLKDWLKKKGITKNVSRSDMFILYTKRLERMITDGKKTIIYKDGRILDDVRLDRFGERNFRDTDYGTYQAATTPDGYTCATPRPTIPDIVADTLLDPVLYEVFTSQRQVHTILGYILDQECSQEKNDHLHQVGVFGLRTTLIQLFENFPMLLRQGLFLARDLMGYVTSHSLTPVSDYASNRPPQNRRVPKIQITFTGADHERFTPAMRYGVISYLKSSRTVTRLLQLGSADQGKWSQNWYTMTQDEETTTKQMCNAFFGLPHSFGSAMSFMHISVLLASPKEPSDIVLMRTSLGIDARDTPDCNICQRQVVSFDGISKGGTLQLNVPLQVSWTKSWEPLHILTSESSENSKWSDYVYSLRGWFIHISSYFHRFGLDLESSLNRSGSDEMIHEEDGTQRMVDEEDETQIWEETWDPMDVFTPLATFQPFDIATPANPCAHADFELTYIGANDLVDESVTFAPDAGDGDFWNPNDI